MSQMKSDLPNGGMIAPKVERMASLKKRNGIYQIQWYENGKQRREGLRTNSLQVAKEKLRQFESAQFQGVDCPLPTRTPVGEIVEAYMEQMKVLRAKRSWSKDLSYLRASFGECCEGLVVASGRAKRCQALRCPDDRRKSLKPIPAAFFEEITTAMISDMIAQHVRVKGLSPKSANRYREVVCKVFNWAIEQGRIRMPGGVNPASKVQRYQERASEIRYLTIPQIEEQLHALRFNPRLQTMVAVLIYSGLRREELLWLRFEDWDRTSLSVPNGILRIHAKTVGGESWQPKTRKNRAITVSRVLASYLNQYVITASDNGWLFPSPKGCLWDTCNFSDALRKTNRSVGLGWSCLDYRHTFGSQLAQKGVSLYKISALMGNSPEICRKHYAALVPEAMGDEVEFIVSSQLIHRS